MKFPAERDIMLVSKNILSFWKTRKYENRRIATCFFRVLFHYLAIRRHSAEIPLSRIFIVQGRITVIDKHVKVVWGLRDCSLEYRTRKRDLKTARDNYRILFAEISIYFGSEECGRCQVESGSWKAWADRELTCGEIKSRHLHTFSILSCRFASYT